MRTVVPRCLGLASIVAMALWFSATLFYNRKTKTGTGQVCSVDAVKTLKRHGFAHFGGCPAHRPIVPYFKDDLACPTS
jgi:hypothetical protein